MDSEFTVIKTNSLIVFTMLFISSVNSYLFGEVFMDTVCEYSLFFFPTFN
jgi:hypothetical protein